MSRCSHSITYHCARPGRAHSDGWHAVCVRLHFLCRVAPETGKRLIIERGVLASAGSASGAAGQPISAAAINQALASEQVRVPIPSDVTQAALLLPPTSFDEAFRNLAWKCTSAERKRLTVANTQYVTFLGLLGAGLVSPTVAATFSDSPRFRPMTREDCLRARWHHRGRICRHLQQLDGCHRRQEKCQCHAQQIRRSAAGIRRSSGRVAAGRGQPPCPAWGKAEHVCSPGDRGSQRQASSGNGSRTGTATAG